MTSGKNKRKFKKSKAKINSFQKNKKFIRVVSPEFFDYKIISNIIINVNITQQVSNKAINKRYVEVSISELINVRLFRKDYFSYHKLIKMKLTKVTKSYCHSDYESYKISNDKIFSLLQKKNSLIECNLKIKTSDNQLLVVHYLTLTKKDKNSFRKSFYGKSSSIKKVRKICTSFIKDTLNHKKTNLIYTICYSNYFNDKLVKLLRSKIHCLGILPIRDLQVIRIRKLSNGSK
uniref:Ribosomal protein 3a n=1 Tax=Amorphochlora amoebiformis TaxID=1561963 RepID=A0A0H5BIJ9_9EUKA|nr:ribosomal protein 3a [Amorphochlora amoebiformis]